MAAKRRRARNRKTTAAAPALAGRSPDVQAWIAREIAEQERRYRKIAREMDALEARRRRWILEFYKRIQTSGFNVHADIKKKIKPEEIPPLPKRKIRVVF